MKSARVHRLAGHLLSSSSSTTGWPPATAALLSVCSFHAGPACTAALSVTPSSTTTSPLTSSRRRTSLLRLSHPAPSRQQSTSASTSSAPDGDATPAAAPAYGSWSGSFNSTATLGSATSAPGSGPSTDPRFPELFPDAAQSSAYPSPLPERAQQSAKLAALHARLGLSPRLPLQTLARALVDVSADTSPLFNNANLAYVGSSLINYHVSEWLMCKYPRLPMVILFGAMKAYAGQQALADVARQWGVEAAAAPGAEVDPGLLQFSLLPDRQYTDRWGYQRAEAENLKKYKWRHSISSRVVFDDDFGDTLEHVAVQHADEPAGTEEQAALAAELGGSMDAAAKTKIADEAHANAVRAVAGAVFAHGGREAAKSFVRAHVLSRQLDLERLFRFKLPTRELSYLCARENFEPPVARLEAETGRKSRTPVFVVGIYSGADKLGEGAGASLHHARQKAAMNALKAWYLYSPGDNVRVPSDTLQEGAVPWEPAYVDIGEIL